MASYPVSISHLLFYQVVVRLVTNIIGLHYDGWSWTFYPCLERFHYQGGLGYNYGCAVCEGNCFGINVN